MIKKQFGPYRSRRSNQMCSMLPQFSICYICNGKQDRSVHLTRPFKAHCQGKTHSLEGKKPGKSQHNLPPLKAKSPHEAAEPHSPPRCKGGPHVTVCAPPAHIPLSRSLPRSSLRVAPAARLGPSCSMLQLLHYTYPGALHTNLLL